MVELEKTMFRAYDLRGQISEKELNEGSAEFIGKGFGTMLRRKGITKCIVGYDYRQYSERLLRAFERGLLSTGINTIEINLCLSPMSYFAQHHLKVKGVAMFTASHNPNGWGGFKLGYDYSSTLLPDDITELYQIILKEDFEKGKGATRKEEVFDVYKKDVVERVKLGKKLKIVIDAGNGTAGKFAPAIFREAGCEVIEHFCDLNWNFPNHEPDPSLLKTMESLGKAVKEKKADLGIAIDGDGDRLGVCNEKGEEVWPDRILILLARLILKKHKGAKIIYEVKCTKGLEEDIKANGGIPIVEKTGHSYIKERSMRENAALAGERSGHIFYTEGYYGFDDAVFAGLKLLEYVSGEEKPFSEIMLTTPQYIQSPVYHTACADEIKYDIVNKLIEKFKQEYGNKVIDIDGARVEFEDGWGLVRASSNLPVLVLVFEAKTEERLKEIIGIFKEKLGKYAEISKEWRS